VLSLGSLDLLLDLLVDHCVLGAVEVLEEGHEERVLDALGDAGDGGTLGLVHLLLVVHGDLHASVLLVVARVVALPNVNFFVEFKNVSVLVFEHGALKRTIFNLVSEHRAGFVFSHVPQAVHHHLLL